MPYVLVAWTVVIWVGRVRNILADDGSAAELVVPGVLLGLAVLSLADRRRFVPLLVVATVAVWAVRVPLVVVRDHDLGFTLVHLALAAVSVALAGLAWRSLARRAPAAQR